MIIRNDNLKLDIGNVCICDKQYNELMKYLWAINNRINNIAVVREIVIKEPSVPRIVKPRQVFIAPTIEKVPVSDETFFIDQKITTGYMEAIMFDNGIYKQQIGDLFWLINGNRRRVISNSKNEKAIKEYLNNYGL